jgi:glycosyltransferase involved in cell wall biosynthesis
VDAVVVLSRAMRSVLTVTGWGTDGDIPTGIELKRLAGATGRRFAAGTASIDRPTLVHVGRLAFEKNVDFLLRMLVHVRGRIPDVLLVIAGEGPSAGHLKALAQRLGLAGHVLFVGYLDRRGALLDCYRAGDAFVFASRTETQGLVLLEAMALGVPVVSTADGHARHPELARGVYRAGSGDRFREKVVQVLGDAGRCQQLREAWVGPAWSACAWRRPWQSDTSAWWIAGLQRGVRGHAGAGDAT